jgi:hypothetical protein
VKPQRKVAGTEKVVGKDNPHIPKPRRKRGDFRLMKDLPVDVALEIFGQLEPIDLLNLSRVSKGLRSLMTSNDVRFRNVAHGDRPPPCPEKTNIVFYTNFVYGRSCQVQVSDFIA